MLDENVDEIVKTLRPEQRHFAAALLGAMLATWAVAYLPWLGLLDLQLEEPRRALVAQSMLETGNYLVPQLAGEPYTAKPPLFNWALTAAAAAAGGLTELSARLPSVLSSLALAVLFVWGTRQVFSRWALAFLAAALLLAPEILAKGRIAEIEPLFALLVAASLGTWYRAYRANASGLVLWIVPLALVALAYLTKREPALAFFYLAVVPFLFVRGRWRLLLAPAHFAGILLAALLIGGWLFSVAATTGWTELWDTLQREVLERGVAGQTWGDVLAHIVFYPFALFAGMLPFSALLPLLASRDVRTRVHERFGDLFVFCALAVAANLPVYWLRGDVAVRYFLPMFPFVLLLATMVFEVLRDDATQSRPVGRYLLVVRTATMAVALAAAAALLFAPALPRLVPSFTPLLPTVVTLAVAAAAAMAAGFLWRQRRRWPWPTLVLLFCTAVLAVRGVYFAVVLADRATRYEQDRNAPAIADRVFELVGNAPVYTDGVPWAIWYYRGPLSLVLRGATAPPNGSWLLVHETLATRYELDEGARLIYKDDVLLLGRAASR